VGEDARSTDTRTQSDEAEDLGDVQTDPGDVAETDSGSDIAGEDTSEPDLVADVTPDEATLDSSDAADTTIETDGGTVSIYEESFETDGEGSRYTSVLAFHGGTNDHFGRTDVASISTASEYTNLDGDYCWAAEDTDDGDGNEEPEQIVTLQAVDVSGYTNLHVTIRVGAGNAADPPEDSTYDSTDYLTVQYSLNGSDSFNDALAFRYVYNGDPYNERLGEDEDGDGKAEGAVLGPNLTEFGFAVPNGSTLTIRVLVRMNGDGEEVAFDLIAISGNPT